MKIRVQKYGGTSVSTAEQRERVVHHIRKALAEGYKVVVVVSAMGRKGDPYATDTLLDLVNQAGAGLAKREQDLLLSCGEIISATMLSSLLHQYQLSHTVLTGGQAGMITNDQHTEAQMITVNPKRIQSELEAGKIVIVTGFQGKTTDGEITTLGRGGSDTSATVLGVALRAECVDIFTDVEGIMTADPRIVEDAVSLPKVSYVEACNLAFQGAKVIHPRAVEVAMQGNIPVRVRSTLLDTEGTLVTDVSEGDFLSESLHGGVITGITQMPCVTQVKVATNPDQLDMQLNIFQQMADHEISVDLINVNPSGVAYTVFDEHAERAREVLQHLGLSPELVPQCAKISLVGAGISGVPGVMAGMLEALTEEGIQILQSADSHTTIWVLVHGKDMKQAVRALHRKFYLHRS